MLEFSTLIISLFSKLRRSLSFTALLLFFLEILRNEGLNINDFSLNPHTSYFHSNFRPLKNFNQNSLSFRQSFNNRVDIPRLSLYKVPISFLAHIDCTVTPRGWNISNAPWEFYLLEENDLSEATSLTRDCFFKPKLTLDPAGMSQIELKFWNCFISMYEWYDKKDFEISTYLGFKSRSSKRLKYPSFNVSYDSFILVATCITKDRSDGPESAVKKEIVGLVEICLEKPSGELAPPIKFSSLLSLSDQNYDACDISEYEPYLCNLCVKDSFRKQRLGMLLCTMSEYLVDHYWGKRNMYLHVEKSNIAAKRLYEGMQYSVVGMKLPHWKIKLLKLDDLFYFRKTWSGSSHSSAIDKG